MGIVVRPVPTPHRWLDGSAGPSSWEAAPHTSNGFLRNPFFHGGVGIAEEDLNTQLVELVMRGQLRTVVEGEAPVPLLNKVLHFVTNLALPRVGGVS